MKRSFKAFASALLLSNCAGVRLIVAVGRGMLVGIPFERSDPPVVGETEDAAGPGLVVAGGAKLGVGTVSVMSVWDGSVGFGLGD